MSKIYIKASDIFDIKDTKKNEWHILTSVMKKH